MLFRSVSLPDVLRLAVRAVTRRPGRAALTVTAVMLASTLLTALLAIAASGRTEVLDQLAGGGPLAGIRVSAAAPSPGQLDSDNPRPGRARDLDDAARRRIGALPGVESVSPVVAAPVLVVPPHSGDDPSSEPFEETMVGVDVGRAGRLPISILAGRLPSPRSKTEAAVTEGYLKRIGLEPESAAAAIGTEIVIGAPRVFADSFGLPLRGRWTRAVVVGVVAQEAATGQLLVPLEAARQAREWTASGGDDDRIEIPTSPYSGLFVVAEHIDLVDDVRAGITDIGYATAAPENLIATVTRYLRVVEIVLAAIGAIALVIAALGIANALLAAVRERRREIGVLKAIGARNRDIARTFVIEAAFVGFAGGVLGAGAGLAVARTVGTVINRYLAEQGLPGATVGLPAPVLAGAVVGSTLLAMTAGTLPALRAAALPAREAMGEL